MSKLNEIFPFCLYHYIDYNTKTYFSSIKLSTVHSDGTTECTKPPKKWHSGGTFYTINPSLIPRSSNLKLFVITQRKYFPYDIYSIIIVTDIFNEIYTDSKNFSPESFEKNYFAAWSKPLPYTTPLYFHGTNQGIFASFSPNPPPADKDIGITKKIMNQNKGSITISNIKDPQFSQQILSPIYVLSNSEFKKGIKDIKFQCLDGALVPYNGKIENLFYYKKPLEPLPINEAIVACNQFSSNNIPNSLENTIKEMAVTNDNKLSVKYYIFIILSFLIILILLIKR